MENNQFYDPFKDFLFEKDVCFLSGQKLHTDQNEPVDLQVFPSALMKSYNMEDQPFKMLDESLANYGHLKLPCTEQVASLYIALEKKIETAFEGGYAAVKDLDQISLFHWISKIVYGVIYCEIRSGIRQQSFTGENMNFSQVLAYKFRNLHAMMQAILHPTEFEGSLPFNILVFPVQNSENHFGYRDEINTLVFSMRLKDFGIVACLQDNGANAIYHEDMLKDLSPARILHPIQFEEICGKFFYSAYLFNRLPEYTYLHTPEKTYIEAMPLSQMNLKPLFDPWQAKTYGQVLENFWKPWGFTLFEIIKDPDHPMEFLSQDKVDLPLD